MLDADGPTGKLAASPGFAPGPTVSETAMLRLHHEAILNGRSGRFCPFDNCL